MLDIQYVKPTREYLLAAADIQNAKKDTSDLLRKNLESMRIEIESKIIDGTYTGQDLINYLRIL